jgi:hypothetical protein
LLISYYSQTCTMQSPVLKGHLFLFPVIENFIWKEPLLRVHLSYKTTFSLSQMWPLNTGLTEYIPYMYLPIYMWTPHICLSTEHENCAVTYSWLQFQQTKICHIKNQTRNYSKVVRYVVYTKTTPLKTFYDEVGW